jgi:hypothetical protein
MNALVLQHWCTGRVGVVPCSHIPQDTDRQDKPELQAAISPTSCLMQHIQLATTQETNTDDEQILHAALNVHL